MILLALIVATYAIAFAKGVSIALPILPLLIAGGVYLYGYAYRNRSAYISSVAKTLSFFVVFTAYYAILTDAVAWGSVLKDEWLLAVDHYMFIDAKAVADYCNEIRWLERVSFIAYFTFVPQIILAILVGTRETFIKRMVVCGIITTMIFAAVPAIGNYEGTDVEGHNAPIMARMQALSDGEVDVLRVQDAEGIICAPSFHTITACLLMAAFWSNPLRWWAVGLNVLMIGSTIPTGGHYVVDVLLGLAVAYGVIRHVR